MMKQRSDTAMAELCLIQCQAHIPQNHIGYWLDMKCVWSDDTFRLNTIINDQPPDVAAKLRQWGGKWKIL